jgi:methyl-accepting chemotaxis protein
VRFRQAVFRHGDTARGSGRERGSVTLIGATTQENAATVEELAGTLDTLRTMAGVLANDMRRFKISRA